MMDMSLHALQNCHHPPHIAKIRPVILLMVCLIVTACQRFSQPPTVRTSTISSSLENIRHEGKVVVLTRNAASIYYEGPDGKALGYEHDLVQAFAAYLGVGVEFEVVPTVKDIMEGLAEGRAHFAAAGLTRTPQRRMAVNFGPVYQRVKIHVVCNQYLQLDSLSSLTGDLVVALGSSYESMLRSLPKGPSFRSLEKSTEEILYEMVDGPFQCTLVDSSILGLHQTLMPKLQVVLTLDEAAEHSWFFPKNQVQLMEAAYAWQKDFAKAGQIAGLQDRYFGHSLEFDSYDIGYFVRMVRIRLPALRTLFEEAANLYSHSWDFLAAMAYQESHWDPMAESPTGVRGLMMLTQITAKEVGVEDRLDPRQSIMGGARYLRILLDRLPAYLEDEDRLWMGLAAYNVGYNHVRDARMLAVWKEKNPNRWPDVETMLPLLSVPSYYERLPHGAARGSEPVIYVQRVRNYWRLLKKVVGIDPYQTASETRSDEVQEL